MPITSLYNHRSCISTSAMFRRRQPTPVHCTSLSTQHVYGRRAFPVAGPTVWNSLSDELRNHRWCNANSFKQFFKTILFSFYQCDYSALEINFNVMRYINSCFSSLSFTCGCTRCLTVDSWYTRHVREKCALYMLVWCRPAEWQLSSTWNTCSPCAAVS